MFNRFVRSFRFKQPGPGVQRYLTNLQQTSFAGIPTFEEARRDYVAATRNQRFVI